MDYLDRLKAKKGWWDHEIAIAPGSDTVMPEGEWEFNDEVAAVFENMLQRSIPDYHIMRQAVNALAFKSLTVKSGSVFNGQRETKVLDVGCSDGLALSSLDGYAAGRDHTIGELHGLDVSSAMLKKAVERSDSRWDLRIQDLREHLPYEDNQFDVVLCVLTLQFTPVVHRQRILDELTRVLRWGGRLILVEKIKAFTPELDDDMVAAYFDHKRTMGYTEEQIERKRLSLEGVLEPLTAQQNELLLEGSGYFHADCFWRWMNFAGWIAVKTWDTPA
tara:strand:+ start:212 stop:1036 length:825 start_codon:yes stop_codon:yes gene_type:complete